jgi:hypothetical protein
VWGKFGRYRIVDTDVNGRRVQKPELQSFDPLRPVAIQWGDWPSYVEPIDGDRVVVCDPSGLWLLRLPSDDPTVMAKLVARPRPVFAPVEPMGPPPVGGDLPWRAVRTIYDSLRNVNVGDGKAAIMFGPRVVADDVYVLACGDGTTTPGATRLIKYALADGRRTELGSAFVEGNTCGFHSPEPGGTSNRRSFSE